MSGGHVFNLSRLPFWAGAVWRTALGGVAAYVVAEAYLLAATRYELPAVDDVPTYAWMLVATYGLFEVVSAQVRARITTVTVGDGRILFETGYVSRATRSLWISEVTGVDTARTLLGRLFGYGDVTVEARGMDAVTVRRLARVDAFVGMVRSSKDASAREMASRR